MLKQNVTIPLCELVGDVIFSVATNGTETASFFFRYDNETFRAFCFNDGKDLDVYRRLKETLKISKGSYVTMHCQLEFYRKKLVSDETWDSYKTGVSNPTSCLVPQYRIMAIDYGLPLELHNALKTNVAQTPTPIGDLSRFERR